MAVASDPSAKPAKKETSAREWSPPFWTGMAFGPWFNLLRRNRFDIDWRHLPITAGITAVSLFSSLQASIQAVQFGWWLRKAKVDQPPLFVLGHWRAGTTLLHEMLVLDQRHASPTTYACLAPAHFVSTEYLSDRFFNFLLPAHRPMDNMPTGWKRPQEEEFALANLGIPSPYVTVAFPNHPPQYQEYLTLEGLSTEEVERWKRGLMKFLSHVCYRAPNKRMVLKSPPHTGRVKTLLEMFPDAKFVHIVRDPYTVFSSTNNLWKSLYTKHGLQTPKYEGLEEYVLDTFERMYDKFERDRPLLRTDQFCELRYEDLVRDPEHELRRIYDLLKLDGFETLSPALREYLASTDGYKTNRYPQLTPQQREQVTERWGRFFSQYGYS